MAVELSLSKPDSGTSWGFRLTGGAEFDVPLMVTKVFKNSIAENAGLQVNDIIQRVNSTPAEPLSHGEAHDLLIAAGNDLILAIRRGEGDITKLYPYLEGVEDHNEEVSEVLREPPKNLEKQTEKGASPQIDLENYLRRDAQIVSTNVIHKNYSKKWSTFLQRPMNELPKKKSEEEKSQVEPYKVLIKKQKKKKPVPYITGQENIKLEENIQSEKNTPEPIDSTPLDEIEVEIEIEPELQQEEDQMDPDQNDTTEGNNETISTELSMEKCSEDEEELTDGNKLEEKIEKSLEAQLADVEKQLRALSQLPSSIQDTLDAVTKQLAKIVSAKQEQDKEGRSQSTNTEPDITNEALEGRESSTSIRDEDFNDDSENKNEQEEEGEIFDYNLTQGEDEDVEKSDEENQQNELEDNRDPETIVTEEEKEALRLEEELKFKQDKDREKKEEFIQRRLEQRPTMPLKPKQIERPIILPGGRRWSQPDDACPAGRQSKMSDEKIATTIETFSEVLVGRAKGINFLKYQPPPKNLDYLQRSEVFKMIHDMEPPVHGIGSRAEKILSEQDYYEMTNKGSS